MFLSPDITWLEGEGWAGLRLYGRPQLGPGGLQQGVGDGGSGAALARVLWALRAEAFRAESLPT